MQDDNTANARIQINSMITQMEGQIVALKICLDLLDGVYTAKIPELDAAKEEIATLTADQSQAVTTLDTPLTQ